MDDQTPEMISRLYSSAKNVHTSTGYARVSGSGVRSGDWLYAEFEALADVLDEHNLDAADYLDFHLSSNPRMTPKRLSGTVAVRRYVKELEKQDRRVPVGECEQRMRGVYVERFRRGGMPVDVAQLVVDALLGSGCPA